MAVCRSHLQKSVDWKGERLGILEMRRHYARYFKGIPDIKEYRLKFVTTDSFEEINALLDEVLEKFGVMELV